MRPIVTDVNTRAMLRVTYMMLFGMLTLVGPRNHALDWGQDRTNPPAAARRCCLLLSYFGHLLILDQQMHYLIDG